MKQSNEFIAFTIHNFSDLLSDRESQVQNFNLPLDNFEQLSFMVLASNFAELVPNRAPFINEDWVDAQNKRLSKTHPNQVGRIDDASGRFFLYLGYKELDQLIHCKARLTDNEIDGVAMIATGLFNRADDVQDMTKSAILIGQACKKAQAFIPTKTEIEPGVMSSDDITLYTLRKELGSLTFDTLATNKPSLTQ